MWVVPVSVDSTMKQRRAVTKKQEALTYRGADRAGKSRILDELTGGITTTLGRCYGPPQAGASRRCWRRCCRYPCRDGELDLTGGEVAFVAADNCGHD
jgi:hypothetical protein